MTKTHPAIVLVKHADESNSVYVNGDCKVFRSDAEYAGSFVSEASGYLWDIEISTPRKSSFDGYSLRYSELY